MMTEIQTSVIGVDFSLWSTASCERFMMHDEISVSNIVAWVGSEPALIEPVGSRSRPRQQKELRSELEPHEDAQD